MANSTNTTITQDPLNSTTLTNESGGTMTSASVIGQTTTVPVIGQTCSPDQINNGNILSQGPYNAGSRVIYSCNNGFYMDGGPVMLCQSDGKLNGTTPNCQQLPTSNAQQVPDWVTWFVFGASIALVILLIVVVILLVCLLKQRRSKVIKVEPAPEIPSEKPKSAEKSPNIINNNNKENNNMSKDQQIEQQKQDEIEQINYQNSEEKIQPAQVQGSSVPAYTEADPRRSVWDGPVPQYDPRRHPAEGYLFPANGRVYNSYVSELEQKRRRSALNDI
ncbi:unnamed protein product [Owenia fusiformis]|uniref:Sushi domain-containing protein n=1 Tax=Owenia fusiformis TaxID=6347 RepID=A0A8S4PXI2_OWEFU|nr:unnamed protein product [Owenia fusiformis]